jgi:hypothetical protein
MRLATDSCLWPGAATWANRPRPDCAFVCAAAGAPALSPAVLRPQRPLTARPPACAVMDCRGKPLRPYAPFALLVAGKPTIGHLS